MSTNLFGNKNVKVEAPPSEQYKQACADYYRDQEMHKGKGVYKIILKELWNIGDRTQGMSTEEFETWTRKREINAKLPRCTDERKGVNINIGGVLIGIVCTVIVIAIIGIPVIVFLGEKFMEVWSRVSK